MLMEEDQLCFCTVTKGPTSPVSSFERSLPETTPGTCAVEVVNSVGWIDFGFCKYLSISVHPSYCTSWG